ncbi:MAG: DNA repair protein RadA [Peptostreptococcaceae bacterium]|jgi:DNA repair protein RadA/Sms|nr:DNA repair protein RadA [Peptostreptococcaceae bacterium]
MAKKKTKFICQNCGTVQLKWMGRCPDCDEWNTLVEELEETTVDRRNVKFIDKISAKKPIKINEIEIGKEERFKTGIEEFDRVLGGGIVKGSLVLIGGAPGIGKSTLLIQVAKILDNIGKKVLYVSGEESVAQIKLRSDRLDIKSEDIYLFGENNLYNIEKIVEELEPEILIIDSIQTMYNPDLSSAPGSVSQVRDSTSSLMKICKGRGISTFIVGHVTKDGGLAGPRVLEHMVDTVIYFEGDRYNTYRMIRAVKNRFGSTNELGLFEMNDKGLKEILNPSSVLISERNKEVSGSCISSIMEGTRPILVEVQALVSPSNVGIPRRTSLGIESSRLSLLLAVLEKRIGINASSKDVYLNIVGGLRLSEPGMDLAIISSIVSSHKNISISEKTVVIGEVGLTGEVRGVSFLEKRLLEAKKLGFEKAIIPKSNLKNVKEIDELKIYGVDNVKNALNIILTD